MLDREPPSAAPEPGHHLVRNHQDAMPIAELANALNVSVGRDQDAVVPTMVSRNIAAIVCGPRT